MSYTYQYVALSRLKTVLGITNTDDDTELQDKIETAGTLINEHTGRIFVLVTETRTFDAPAGLVLPVVDLQASPAPVVHQGGTLLTAGTDYLLQPESLTALAPTYTGLARVQGGFVRRWGYKPAARGLVSVPVGRASESDYYPPLYGPYASLSLAASEGTVTVTGQWGYGATPPPKVALAAEILASRMWHQRMRQYNDTATAADGSAIPYTGPLWTRDVDDLVQHYKVLPA
jgi:hypothetical protein